MVCFFYFTENNLKCQIDATCIKNTCSEKSQVPFHDTNTETYIDIFKINRVHMQI